MFCLPDVKRTAPTAAAEMSAVVPVRTFLKEMSTTIFLRRLWKIPKLTEAYMKLT
jgi:hypothetical protein